jgi:hypothetical protein
VLRNGFFDWLKKKTSTCLTSGFRREVDEIYDLLGYYASSNGNFLPMFRDNPSGTSSRAKNSNKWHS